MIINIDYKLILEKLNNSGIQAKEYKLNLKKGKNLSFTQLAVLCGSLGISLDEVIIVEDETNVQPRTRKPDIEFIINHLNTKADKNFKLVKANTGLIDDRYREGYTLEDFLVVIDYKVRQWKGTEWEKYLRPSTLFSVKNFEKYVNEAHFYLHIEVTDKEESDSKGSED